jgi:hypothetical protein
VVDVFFLDHTKITIRQVMLPVQYLSAHEIQVTTVDELIFCNGVDYVVTYPEKSYGR